MADSALTQILKTFNIFLFLSTTSSFSPESNSRLQTLRVHLTLTGPLLKSVLDAVLITHLFVSVQLLALD